MGGTVLRAFDTLLGEMRQEEAQLADTVREIALRGQFVEAQRLLKTIRRIEWLIGRVQDLRKSWEQLEAVNASSSPQQSAGDERPQPVEQEAEAEDEQEAFELRVVQSLFGGSPSVKRGVRRS